MKSTSLLTILVGVVGVGAVWSQAPAPAPLRTGPGVQASQDAREADLLKTCKVQPEARGGGGPAKGGGGKGAPGKGAPGNGPQGRGAASTDAKEYKVTAIPGIIAAGQQWKEYWKVDGNNADGIIGTSDGGLLIAQNDNSAVVKLDKNGKTSVAYMGTNTGGSVDTNSKGALFVLNRGFNPSVEQLAPKRQMLANMMDGEPLDCIRSVLNDIAAASDGGVYFTAGTVFHVDAKGVVTRYGQMLNTNGIILAPDEKHLYVTNGGTIAGFDVAKDGSLTNQREFAKLEAGGAGDGMTFDSAGRIYVTSGFGVQVIGPDGKYLGVIPVPRGIISVAFSGPNRKTLYIVARTGDRDWILGIPTIAQGAKGRGK